MYQCMLRVLTSEKDYVMTATLNIPDIKYAFIMDKFN